jgi:hypothetical protein
MNVEKLLKALDDQSNETLLNFTTKKLKDMNREILNELGFSKELTQQYFNKLKDYKYVDEMNDLKYGTYIRWIPLTNPNNTALTSGATFCEYKFTDEGVFMVCKNFYGKHFQIKMEDNLIFQKLTQQELVLLSALDHLSK